MKRKRQQLTLWDACHVQNHGTMWHWWKSIRRKDFGGQCNHEHSYFDCAQETMHNTLLSKVARTEQSTQKLLTTFSVGVKPTSFQKQVLNKMLRVTNYTYNWCLLLVNEMNVAPKQNILQTIVCKTNAKDVDPVYRQPNDEWFFDNKMSTIKLTACKNFCSSFKSAEALKSSLTEKRADGECIREGQIEIQKRFVRQLRDKETCSGSRNNHIVIMKDSFKSPLRISKKVHKIPPIDHDFKIVKRPDGRFVLQIPCNPKLTRRDSSKDTFEKSICGVDPGGRTFATVYDPIEHNAFQVGTKEDKLYDIKPIHEKLDKAHRYLKHAQSCNQAKAIEERKAQLRKLYFKRKTFVNNIHLTLSSHLIKHYQLVSLGKISVSKIVKKVTGKKTLHPRARRDLLCWRHYAFRQRLLHRSLESECQLVIQNEAYTSKTCGLCGLRNKTLGSSETFICKSCQYETHRDINGARNILLKTLKTFPFEV